MRSLQSLLVTGGAGFIGSTLVRRLLDRTEVESLIVLDKLTYAGDCTNLIGPDQDPRFVFVKGDIGDTPLVTRILGEHSVTGILHLAAESHVDRSIDDASPFLATNIVGTANLLEVARRAEIPLLHCSTDEVYGSIPEPELTDESAPLRPSSPYSASKASADLLIQAAHTTYGQDVVIARCSNNYGIRQHREKLIPTLIYHALRDQPLPIYGSGENVRDWIHVDDCARGLIAVFEKGGLNQIYNLGARSERTNLEIARHVLHLLGKPESLITHIGDRLGHDARYALDSTRARTDLAWQPQVTFEEGFAKVVAKLGETLRP